MHCPLSVRALKGSLAAIKDWFKYLTSMQAELVYSYIHKSLILR